MMALNIGDVCFLDYGEVPRCVHARLIVGVVDAGSHEYLICTPDFDIYIEICHVSNPDISHFYLPGPRNALPARVPAADIYGFAPMDANTYARLLREGRTEVAAELARRGVPGGAAVVPGAAAAAGPAAAPVAAPPAGGAAVGSFWALAECIGDHKIGERVVPVAGFPMMGDYGLHMMTDADGVARPCLIKKVDQESLASFCEQRIQLARASESLEGDDRYAADDIRTMSIRYSASGERHRPFRDSIAEMSNTEMDDFPFEIRTCLPYLQAVQSVAESAYAQHLAWVQQSKVPEGSRAVYEDEALCRIPDTAISFDCLCVTNLACFELLVRRRQLIAEAHAYNPMSPKYEGAEHWMGSRFKQGGAIVVPALTDHVAKRLQSEYQILKEKRKLEEVKGKGKNKPLKPAPKQAAASTA